MPHCITGKSHTIHVQPMAPINFSNLATLKAVFTEVVKLQRVIKQELSSSWDGQPWPQ